MPNSISKSTSKLKSKENIYTSKPFQGEKNLYNQIAETNYQNQKKASMLSISGTFYITLNYIWNFP